MLSIRVESFLTSFAISKDTDALHLMKDRVMRTVHSVAAVHVARDQKLAMALIRNHVDEEKKGVWHLYF